MPELKLALQGRFRLVLAAGPSRHLGRTASDCPTSSRPGPATQLVLADVVPLPAAGIAFGVTSDMVDFLVSQHDPWSCSCALPSLPELLPVARDGWLACPVAMGQASFSIDSVPARAAVGLALLSQARHLGCAFNELADGIAKAGARRTLPATYCLDEAVIWTAAAEGVCDWLWITATSPRLTGSLPPLSDSGTWSAAACQFTPVAGPDCSYFRPGSSAPTSPCDALTLDMLAVQYNCLSLCNFAARPMMDAGLRRLGVVAAGLQKTRSQATRVSSTGSFWVLSSAATCSGIGGCQIWLSRTAAFLRGSGTACGWKRDSFSILVDQPQLPVALATVGLCSSGWSGVTRLMPPGHRLKGMTGGDSCRTASAGWCVPCFSWMRTRGSKAAPLPLPPLTLHPCVPMLRLCSSGRPRPGSHCAV